MTVLASRTKLSTGWVSMNEWTGMMNTWSTFGALDGYCKEGMDGDCIQYKVQTLYIDWEFSSDTGWEICIYGGVCCCFSRLHSDDEFVLFFLLLDCCLLIGKATDKYGRSANANATQFNDLCAQLLRYMFLVRRMILGKCHILGPMTLRGRCGSAV
jgi:hypothetical protein